MEGGRGEEGVRRRGKLVVGWEGRGRERKGGTEGKGRDGI